MDDSPAAGLRKIAVVLLLIASFTTGLLIIAYATSIGPWAYSDSTSYLISASNLAAGKGLTVQDSYGNYPLLIWHPPLFPLLLSLPISLGADPLQAARWMNALLFALFCAFTLGATFRFSRSILLSVGVGLLTLFSPDLIHVFSGAMSEGVFLFCGFLGLFWLAEYLNAPISLAKLSLAGIFIGLSYLARYTGIATIGAGFFAMLILSRTREWKEQITRLLIYITSAGLLPGLWTLRVYLETGTFSGRSLAVTTPILSGLQEYALHFWQTLTGWLPFILRGNHIIPAGTKLILGCGAMVTAVVVLILLARKRGVAGQLRDQTVWASVLGLFILCYLAFHLASYLFSNARPEVDWRLLSPVLSALYLIIPMLFSGYQSLVKPTWLVSGLFLLVCLITVWYFHGKTQLLLFEMHHYGEGYTSKRWKGHEIFEQIRQLEPGSTLLSNDPALVLFYTGVHPLPINKNDLDNPLPVGGSKKVHLIIFYPQADYQLGQEFDAWLARVKAEFQSVFKAQNAEIFRWDPP